MQAQSSAQAHAGAASAARDELEKLRAVTLETLNSPLRTPPRMSADGDGTAAAPTRAADEVERLRDRLAAAEAEVNPNEKGLFLVSYVARRSHFIPIPWSLGKALLHSGYTVVTQMLSLLLPQHKALVVTLVRRDMFQLQATRLRAGHGVGAGSGRAPSAADAHAEQREVVQLRRQVTKAQSQAGPCLHCSLKEACLHELTYPPISQLMWSASKMRSCSRESVCVSSLGVMHVPAPPSTSSCHLHRPTA